MSKLKESYNKVGHAYGTLDGGADSFISVFGRKYVSVDVFEGVAKGSKNAGIYLDVAEAKKLVKNLNAAIKAVEANAGLEEGVSS